jgi:hypothetical protein
VVSQIEPISRLAGEMERSPPEPPLGPLRHLHRERWILGLELRCNLEQTVRFRRERIERQQPDVFDGLSEAALIGGVEAPDRLHEIVVQLEPKTSLASRVDVDDPATHRELARLFDQVNAPKARSGQFRRQCTEIDPLSGTDPERGVCDRPWDRHRRTEQSGWHHQQIHRTLRNPVEKFDRLHPSRQRRLGTEIGARELRRSDPYPKIWRQQLQSRSQIPGLCNMRHDRQGESLRPTMGGDRRHRQGAGTRHHTANREAGSAFSEFAR